MIKHNKNDKIIIYIVFDCNIIYNIYLYQWVENVLQE